ncbi:hypothetical protein WOLCODRAFT_70197 [Wolfiporia cocos MD-104 SS10]|uniref:Uncharacterized protein n=1 Tax=Wolfiporia cocos (strain MD-104) TaxID=742152 RepID=A0A2H3JXG4_WOLCO|nr:hypothetical protein WOLCODRAFT_70197 [Wolfiporia cocos MD-104 SS10]
MNPLSVRPPRTPRPPSVSSTNVYGTEVYVNGSNANDDAPARDDVSEDDPDDRVLAEAQSKVRKAEIWREMLKTSYGRDKAFKIMQYSLRVYLLFHTSVIATSLLRRNKARPAWDVELVKRCESTIAGFSLTRSCLIMFNWLTPLTSIMQQHASVPFASSVSSNAAPSSHKTKTKPFLHTVLHAPPPVLLELVNGIADDVYAWARLGLIGPNAGERAGRFADCCWLASTLINLVENTVERGVILDQQHEGRYRHPIFFESRLYADSMTGATTKSNPASNKIDEKELARLQKQDYWIQITRLKLLMDLIFVSYNVFRLQRAKSQIQTFTGLAAAALSTAKAYDRHKTALVKTLHHQ